MKEIVYNILLTPIVLLSLIVFVAVMAIQTYKDLKYGH
jgi:hypothetical protein